MQGDQNNQNQQNDAGNDQKNQPHHKVEEVDDDIVQEYKKMGESLDSSRANSE